MNLAKISSRFIGIPYELGKMDCFMAVVRYLQEMGRAPDINEYQGITLETYAKVFLNDPERVKNIMVQLMDDYFSVVDSKKASPGDIALLKLRGSSTLPFLGIIAGNAIIIIATEQDGVTTYPLKHYKILRAWRCQGQE